MATQIAIGGAALFPAEVHAQYRDRVRPPGGAEFRGRDRALRAIRGGARAQHPARSCEETRRNHARFRRGTERRGDGAAAASRKTSGRCCWPRRRPIRPWSARSRAGEPAHVAKYAFQLAQAFSNFYQQYPIIHEENREKKVFLFWMTDFFRRQLERTARFWESRSRRTCDGARRILQRGDMEGRGLRVEERIREGAGGAGVEWVCFPRVTMKSKAAPKKIPAVSAWH